MARHILTDEHLAALGEAYEKNNRNLQKLSNETGVHRATLKYQLLQASIRGLLPSSPMSPEPGQIIKRTSTLIDHRTGEKMMEWVITEKDDADRKAAVAAIESTMERLRGSMLVTPQPDDTVSETVTLYPIADHHFLLQSFACETREREDETLESSKSRMIEGISDLAQRSPPSETALLVGMGDFFHVNNTKGITDKSGHPLQLSGTLVTHYDAGVELWVNTIRILLRRHELVIVRILRGNHDDLVAVCLASALKWAFSEEPRVIVINDPSLYFYYSAGVTLLGFTHEHSVKQEDLPSRMTNHKRREWGEAEFAAFWTAHLHHKEAKDIGGVSCERLRATCLSSAYEAAGPWVAIRSMISVTYDFAEGEVSRQIRMIKTHMSREH